ncbi:MAG: serine/threonine-protein kinase, partial [Planctomycetota bacterium]
MNHASTDTLQPPNVERSPGAAGDFDTLSGDLDDALADDLTLSGDLPAAGDVDQPAQPRTIGPYRILRQLGRGGMGCVYLAQQERPVERLVAIKLASPGFTGDGSRVLQRFESERRTLSLLDHPNIARILDAGTADDALSSWPYFVMEYVQGDTITDYCDVRRLNLTDRVRLFIDVCRAVQHAHFKGIVHRDIKPSNLLVRANDRPGDGKTRHEVKVIDFGIAAILEGDTGQPVATLTEAGSPIGTPHYASPEQLRLLDDNAVDLRSDVYGLGIVLYEILSGRLPWTPTDTAAGDSSWHAILQRINAGDAPAPSRRVLQLDADEVIARGGRSPQALAKELGGDLDWIVRRAIERLPQDRYASVGELADDLERYLEGEPVLAGPPSQLYRVRKFVARNRVGVAAAGMVAASLLAGLAGTSYYAVQSRQEARNARAAEQSAIDSEQLARQSLLDARESELLATRSEEAAIAAKEEAVLRANEADASAAYLLDVISLADPFETASIRTRDHLITQIIDKLDEAAAPLVVSRPESLTTMSLVPTIRGLASAGEGGFDDYDRRTPLSPATEADLRDRLGHALLLHCRYIEGSVQLERAAVLLEQLADEETDAEQQRELYRRSVLAKRGSWECLLNMGPAYRES